MLHFYGVSRSLASKAMEEAIAEELPGSRTARLLYRLEYLDLCARYTGAKIG